MKNTLFKSLAGLGLLAVVLSTPAMAIDNGGPVDTAIKNKVVGEMANGYLGFVKPATPDQIELSRKINEINAARRTFFAETANKYGQTIDAAAITSALRQIKEKTQIGEFFKDTNGTWCAKSASSVIEARSDGSIVIICQ